MLISPAMAIGSGFYKPLVAEFEAHDWQARALLRRGFEKNEPPASRRLDWTYLDEIDDIGAAVTQARAEESERPVILLGHSLGGQLVTGHQLLHRPADGVVTVGGAIPHYPHYRYGGFHLAALAALAVPATTTVLGYVPKPLFGGPGARTFMRQWARMVLSGRPPFQPEDHAGDRITTPALIVSLDHDQLSPRSAVDQLADYYADDKTTRWHYRDDQVPPGSSNDHIRWVRTPSTVVEHILTWWQTPEST